MSGSSDIRADCVKNRVVLLWLHLRLKYSTIVNFISSYCSIPAKRLSHAQQLKLTDVSKLTFKLARGATELAIITVANYLALLPLSR